MLKWLHTFNKYRVVQKVTEYPTYTSTHHSVQKRWLFGRKWKTILNKFCPTAEKALEFVKQYEEQDKAERNAKTYYIYPRK